MTDVPAATSRDTLSASKRAIEDQLQEIRRLLEAKATEISGGVGDKILARLDEISSTLAHILHDEQAGVESRYLKSIATLLARTLNTQGVLDTIMEALQDTIEFDAAGIHVLEDDGTSIHAQSTRGYTHEALNNVNQKVNEGLIGWAIRHGEPLIVDDTGEDARYIAANLSTQSEMVVPIISGHQTIGSINLESNRRAAFDTKQLQYVEALASHAAVALERARVHDKLIAARQLEKELQIARSIQVALLPRRPPALPGYDVSGLNIPSHEVGGDYFDYIPITETDIGIVIADVAGKGVPAGLIMSGLRGALRSRVQNLYSVRQIIVELNRFLHESTGPEAFVTLFYGVLNTVQHRLTYVNAGHNPPMLLHRDGRIVPLTAGGPLLGVIGDAVYHEGIASLEPGALLVMFTDGIVEAGGEEGREFGEQRVETTIRAMADGPACALAAELERTATRWAEQSGETDDRTVIVVKRL